MNGLQYAVNCAQDTLQNHQIPVSYTHLDVYKRQAPGWFFTYTEQVTIEKDKNYPLTATMKQQVRELMLVVEPTRCV